MHSAIAWVHVGVVLPPRFYRFFPKTVQKPPFTQAAVHSLQLIEQSKDVFLLLAEFVTEEAWGSMGYSKNAGL